jgi:hypothetical protein
MIHGLTERRPSGSEPYVDGLYVEEGPAVEEAAAVAAAGRSGVISSASWTAFQESH